MARTGAPPAGGPDMTVELVPPAVVDVEPLSVEDIPEWAPGLDHPLIDTKLEWTGPLSVEEARQIHARVVFSELPMWRRAITRKPQGWRS